MRRRKLIAAVGLAVLVAVGAFVLCPRQDRITLDDFIRINYGISRAEVEAILGPPGNYTTAYVSYRNGQGSFHSPPVGNNAADGKWWTNAAAVSVEYDESGHLTRKMFAPADQSDLNSFDNLLWRAKRLWRRWFPE
jgi:hypothetical protein